MFTFTPLPIGTILQHRYRLTADENELDTQLAGAEVNQTANKHILGMGGQGAVYLALHKGLKRYVALKQTLLAGDSDSIYALEREAQLLAGLNYHPALPQVYELFEENGSHFLVMELVRGENLLEMMNSGSGKLPFEKVLDITLQLLDILDFLHKQNIIHKDIKPANLKLTDNGQLKLLDFGLAKGSVGLMSKHINSIFKGSTPAYASPEQDAELPTNAQSDLYSTAATVFHLLTGKIPPKCNIRSHYINNKKPDPLRFVSEIEATIPYWFAKILHEALSLLPDERPPSAFNMSEKIRQQYKIELEEQRLEIEKRNIEADKLFNAAQRRSYIAEDEAYCLDNYTKAIELKPTFAESYKARADVYYRIRNDDQAIADYTEAIALKSNYAEAYFGRATVYEVRKGDFNKAIEDYTKAIEYNKSYSIYYIRRAQLYSEIGNYSQALADFTKAIELSPDYDWGYNRRGFFYKDRGNYDQAINDFTKLIELSPEPNYYFYYSWRAETYEAKGDLIKAEADRDKAKELEAMSKINRQNG